MSMKSTLDVVLHIENFRNIDLYYQGLYHLKFNIYMEKTTSQKIFAHPYLLSESYKPYPVDPVKGIKAFENPHFKCASILEKTSSFLTKAFFIKFCQEQIQLNDLCHFRIDLDLTPQQEQSKLFLECSLMFFDPTNNNEKGKDQDRLKEVDKEQQQEGAFGNQSSASIHQDSQLLSSVVIQINKPLQGVHQFVPLLFEDQNFSVTNMMVHTLLLDHRFRVVDMQLSFFAQLKPEEKMALIDTGKLNGVSVSQFSEANPVSIFESLKENYKGSITLEQINQLLVESLQQAYQSLFEHYNYISSKCILEKQKKYFKKYLQPPMKLIIPAYGSNDIVGRENIPKDFNAMLQEKFRSTDPQAITHAILNQSNLISGQLLQLWHQYLDLYQISPQFCSAVLQYEYIEKLDKRWLEFVDQKVAHSEQFLQKHDSSIFEQYRIKADKIRNKPESVVDVKINVETAGIFSQPKLSPVIFEDWIIRDSGFDDNQQNISDGESDEDENDDSYYKGIHLIVLVHGFQGNSFDMKLLKNYMNYLHPESMFLCSAINEDNTEGDIFEMGKKLAQEVNNFIGDNLPGSTLGRISFVGHSLGGLIIRAALPELSDFTDKMFTYMSLSSPHLGYMYNTSNIIEAGMWILQRWRKSECLTQLSMGDNPQLEETTLFRLSLAKGLGWFQNVILVSSLQDQYAPYDSARIQYSKDAEKDTQKGTVYMNMAKNILKNLNCQSLLRLSVNFNIQQKNLDSLIGRTAHILFLECQPLIRMLVHKYDQFFN